MFDLTSADTIAIVLCVTFLAYVAAILGPLIKRRGVVTGEAADFTWHLIVPCLDEALVIERSLRRLRRDHPFVHVWCVDDASTDETPAILRRLSDTDDYIHVVTRRAPEARQGKGAALNAAYRQIAEWERHRWVPADLGRVIVGVVDADGRLSPDAFNVLAGKGSFGDNDVSAVQIQVRMVNRGLSTIDADEPAATTRFGRLLVTLQDLEFRTVIAAMQHLRHRIGNAGMGGNGQFTRLTTLNAIAATYGEPWHGALLEDFELGLHVLLNGGRNSYCDETWVAQEGLPKLRPLVRQRTRWAQGGMQCAKYLRAVLQSREVSTPAALEICYFLLVTWTQIVGSVVYTLSAAAVASYMFGGTGSPAHWFLTGGWGLLPLVLVFGIAPMAVWGLIYRLRCESGLSRTRALGLGLAYWLYSYVMVAAVWRAMFRLVLSRNGWAKTSRVNADPVSPLPAGSTASK